MLSDSDVCSTFRNRPPLSYQFALRKRHQLIFNKKCSALVGPDVQGGDHKAVRDRFVMKKIKPQRGEVFANHMDRCANRGTRLVV